MCGVCFSLYQMKLLILLAMLTSCAALPQSK